MINPDSLFITEYLAYQRAQASNILARARNHGVTAEQLRKIPFQELERIEFGHKVERLEVEE